MRVLFKDENGNLTLMDVVGIGKGNTDFECIALTLSASALICDDKELYIKYDSFIRENMHADVIDLSHYKFVDLKTALLNWLDK